MATAVATPPAAQEARGHPAPPVVPPPVVPPLAGRPALVRSMLVGVLVLTMGFLLYLIVFSSFSQRAAQQEAYDKFRAELAEGTAPVGQLDREGAAIAMGAPVAQLEIPALGLRQVVLEGTTSGILFDGPGHRRDTVFPGQQGTSVILGRRASFGAPFARLGELDVGDRIYLTTGQGEFEFKVEGLRRDGDPVPEPLDDGQARITLATADGSPFLPSGVVRVDALLEGTAVKGNAPIFNAATLPPAERMMAADTSTLWALVLWLQLLIAVVAGAVWAWLRWGRARTWLVFLPPLLLVGGATAAEAARLLPNLL